MRYRHFAPFQAILQSALLSATKQRAKGQERSLTAVEYISKLGLEKKLRPERLARFRTFKFTEDHFKQQLDDSYLTPKDINSPLLDRFTATTLWDDQYNEGHIQAALKRHPKVLSKKTAFSPAETASSIASFYATHDSQIVELDKKGFSTPEGKDWFCYKLSNRFPGYLIKSRMELTTKRDHISIYERQTARKDTEIMGVEEYEESTGFAISKAHKLWFFLREDEAEQPRIICFHELRERTFSSDEPNSTLNQLGYAPRQMLILLGSVIEMDRKWNNQFFASPVALTLPAYEESLWKDHHGDREYNSQIQCNLHPFAAEHRKPHKDFFIPKAVKNHLRFKSEIPR